MNDLDTTLAELATRWRVPGAAIAIVRGGVLVDAYTGVQSATGRAVDRASIFEIGSITKAFTATLILQLVDEGVIGLDDPIPTLLPDFTLADPEITQRVTVRHLLTHTPGFDGDDFTDTGDDAHALERYVMRLAQAPSFAEPGAMFSYCNAGISVLGRIVEVIRRLPFDDALATHLLQPLGLASAYPHPASAPAELIVTGHREPDGDEVPTMAIPRSLAPSGARLSMTARDLAIFGTLHLDRRAPRAEALLSAQAVAAMRTAQPGLVPYLGAKWGSSRGLGWDLFDGRGALIAGHNGHTLGQVAALRVVPDRDLVVAVLTNGGASYRLIDGVLTKVFGEVAGDSVPPVAETIHAAGIDVTPYVGRYAGLAVQWTVEPAADGELRLIVHDVDDGLPVGAGARVELRHLRDHTFMATDDDCGARPVYTFLLDDSGRGAFLHNGRAYPRL